jgi:hypothetical protein
MSCKDLPHNSGITLLISKMDEGEDPQDHLPANSNTIQPMRLVPRAKALAISSFGAAGDDWFHGRDGLGKRLDRIRFWRRVR